MAERGSDQATIGFVGIGAMGWPMAARLVRAGHSVLVHDARSDRMAGFVDEIGGVAVDDLPDLARRVTLLITMLPTSAIVEDVLFKPDGVASGLRSGSLLIEMSSGVPATTQRLADRLGLQGVRTIDAPVSGGVARAITGELAIMMGGRDTDIAEAEPVLRAMGKALLRTGPLGSGQAMKALNNLVSAGTFLMGIEALLIGQRFGLDPDVMVDVLNVSSGRSNATEIKLKQFVLSRSFASGFALDLMVKDLGIATQVARDGHVAAPLSSMCEQLWKAAHATLGSGLDHTAVARFSELLAHEELASGGSSKPD